MILGLMIFGASALLVYSFYVYVASTTWDEAEIRELEKVELHLAHILRLLDAPDVRMLLENEEAREDLLLEFSNHLKEDVRELWKGGGIRFASAFFVGAFFLSYYLIRFKTRWLRGRDDLRFLSGLELALFRSLK